jgi:hypothetical protein
VTEEHRAHRVNHAARTVNSSVFVARINLTIGSFQERGAWYLCLGLRLRLGLRFALRLALEVGVGVGVRVIDGTFRV